MKKVMTFIFLFASVYSFGESISFENDLIGAWFTIGKVPGKEQSRTLRVEYYFSSDNGTLLLKMNEDIFRTYHFDKYDDMVKIYKDDPQVVHFIIYCENQTLRIKSPMAISYAFSDPQRIVMNTSSLFGKSNDSFVRIRSNPGLEGQQLGYLQQGDSVEILSFTENEMEIDEMKAPWYQIRTQYGIEGWVYGYFIDFIFDK